MPLQPGTTLGPYSATVKICEGGMGEVYRATEDSPIHQSGPAVAHSSATVRNRLTLSFPIT